VATVEIRGAAAAFRLAFTAPLAGAGGAGGPVPAEAPVVLEPLPPPPQAATARVAAVAEARSARRVIRQELARRTGPSNGCRRSDDGC
jgi:hypothetical protein